MARVSVVIPVWNQWALTRGCLASLAPTLRADDEVVVVDNGSRDGTAAGLAQLARVTVVTNPSNRGFAAACNQGARAATAPIVVFLNNDTLVPADWLDGLLAPFADPTIVATGPMSNCAAGAQHVAMPDYDPASPDSFRAYAAAWRCAHRGQSTEAPRLVGFCLAVRAAALRAIGGWDEGFATGGAEDDDLCVRLRAAGGRLAICHETFVHHHGHATFDGNRLDRVAIEQANLDRFVAKHTGRTRPPRSKAGPLLSVCLIVRDERDVLPACLRAVTGVADEVVVYDTGSTDGSQACARAAGARVVQGEWHDDFARARNAALAHCTGTWVLQVDADEVFEGDPAAVRAALAAGYADAFALEIRNLRADGTHDVAHRACRLFRRLSFRWQGRLHEQIVHRVDGHRYPLAMLPGARLLHSGYTPERIRRKGKAERNLRLAASEGDAALAGDPVATVVNLACAYVLVGRDEEALGLLVQARGLAGESRALRRRICRTAAQLCLAMERPDAALAWIDDLAGASASSDLARYLRGRSCVGLRCWQDALDAYAGLTEVRDEDGMVLPRLVIHRDRARCLYMLEQWDAAFEQAAVLATGVTCREEIWHVLAVSAHRTGRALAPLLDQVPEAALPAVFAQFLSLDPTVADAVLEALLAQPRYQAHALALAVRLAPAMPAAAAGRWSDRLRDVGLADVALPPADGR